MGVLSTVTTTLTLTALLRLTFDILDLARASTHQRPDYDRLHLRLEIERCRLLEWARTVGIVDVIVDGNTRQIGEFRFAETVKGILGELVGLFMGVEGVVGRYSCHDGNGIANEVGSGRDWWWVRVKENVVWVVRDRARFRGLVGEIRELVDRLRDVTCPPTGAIIGTGYGNGRVEGGSGVGIRDRTLVGGTVCGRRDGLLGSATTAPARLAPLDGFWNDPSDELWVPRSSVSRFRGAKL